MSKSCVICGGGESEGELLIEAPCGRHWVCSDDVTTFFENATNNESLFPPKCCGQMFMLEDYEDYVPFEAAWAYQMKQSGEYAILAKFRVYCANPPCVKFLHPTSHVEDPETKITYAICEGEDCGQLTCVKCKKVLDQGTQNHTCEQNEEDKEFKKTAGEKGYQECFVCGATVELAEACNHITCECGNSFCYICGQNWQGLHGCPHYGPAVYDEEGYNQLGFHRNTGLNRGGLTRRQDMARARGEGIHDEEDEEEEGEEENPDWEILQHLTPDQRAMINQLPHGVREDTLDQFRLQLFMEQGVLFQQGHAQPPPPPPPQPQADAENGDLGIEDNDSVHGAAEDPLFDEDSDLDSDEENHDPLSDDDGDHFIHEEEEEALQGARFADEQSKDAEVAPLNEQNIDAMYARNQDAWASGTLHAASDTVDFNSEASYIGSDTNLDERMRKDFGDEMQQEGRLLSSSEDEDGRPTTPMEIDGPVAAEKGVEVQGPLERRQTLPGAWVDDDL
ncbi:hypothetical protein EJ02DRAFT_346572 [Clathrospora elynae]|uniref:RBR-type E3 ubiquitin transferase n=1 Tax=Clathrospora elynae TaxID=706981 RepID=A0A6A5SP77_9PLEO|nr:hypothetical protein EJ02DRAFT_346572 [Clathrospora elynae]